MLSEVVVFVLVFVFVFVLVEVVVESVVILVAVQFSVPAVHSPVAWAKEKFERVRPAINIIAHSIRFILLCSL